MASSQRVSWEPVAEWIPCWAFQSKEEPAAGNRASESYRAGKSLRQMKTQQKATDTGPGIGLGQNQWPHLSDSSDTTGIIFIFVCILPRMST